MITTLIIWYIISSIFFFYLLIKLWKLEEDIKLMKFTYNENVYIINKNTKMYDNKFENIDKQIRDTEIWLEDLEEKVDLLDTIQNILIDTTIETLDKLEDNIPKSKSNDKKEGWKKSTTKKV